MRVQKFCSPEPDRDPRRTLVFPSTMTSARGSSRRPLRDTITSKSHRQIATLLGAVPVIDRRGQTIDWSTFCCQTDRKRRATRGTELAWLLCIRAPAPVRVTGAQRVTVEHWHERRSTLAFPDCDPVFHKAAPTGPTSQTLTTPRSSGLRGSGTSQQIGGQQIGFNSSNNPDEAPGGAGPGRCFLWNNIVARSLHCVGNNSGTRLNKREKRCCNITPQTRVNTFATQSGVYFSALLLKWRLQTHIKRSFITVNGFLRWSDFFHFYRLLIYHQSFGGRLLRICGSVSNGSTELHENRPECTFFSPVCRFIDTLHLISSNMFY